MKIQTIDNLKFLLETIYGDHYLKTYFNLRWTDMHLKQNLDDTVKDFALFRNSIVDEKIAAKNSNTPLLSVTRLITL
jgi:hypothetical protein